ncbi:OpgC family protein [Sphingomonas sp. 3-13AW]|jgi:hypothetical protein|uniref:OpgC family protein n=1 Tax=Sphingomonas sp. 3-13AW TaxID=3050450 RepID=UPI003BB7B586
MIDGLRGFFLVFMLINHLVFEGGYWMLRVNHNQLAFVEDAQGFVFLSGLMIGLVYGRKMMRQGYDAGSRMIRARALELYRYAMAIVLAVLVARMILPYADPLWFNWLGDTSLTGDPLRLAAVATFLFQPTVMDILPQYVIYMLAAPPVVWLCLNGHVAKVAAGSALLWFVGQLGVHQLITDPVSAWITSTDGQGIRTGFNLLGWQIVFFAGAAIGALMASERIDWSALLRPDRTLVPWICLITCLLLLPLRITTAHGLLPPDLAAKVTTLEIRADFSLIYLVNFIAAALGLSWLLVAGAQHHRPQVRSLATALRSFFSLGPLRLLGRHSLYVYVWHVAIVYLVYYIDQASPPFSQATKTMIALVSLALLPLPALWRERGAREVVRKPVPAHS